MLLDPILTRLGLEPGDIAGAYVAGQLPLTDSAVNRLIAKRLWSHPHIASVQVASQDQDVAFVRIELRSRVVPPVNIVVRIERQPSLPGDPTIVLRWSMPAAGPLAMLAGPVLGFLKKMPEGVRIDRDLITVDLRTLLRARGLEEVLGLVRRVALHTRPGVFVLQFEAGWSG